MVAKPNGNNSYNGLKFYNFHIWQGYIFFYAIECPEKFTSLYSVMNSIGPFFCRAVGSQTFNVYVDKVGVF